MPTACRARSWSSRCRCSTRSHPTLQPPISYRTGADAPTVRRVEQEHLLAEAYREAERLAESDGLLAVIVPEELRADVPQDDLWDGVPVLTPREAKGLEFDHVVVVEPALIETARALRRAVTADEDARGRARAGSSRRASLRLAGGEAGARRACDGALDAAERAAGRRQVPLDGSGDDVDGQRAAESVSGRRCGSRSGGRADRGTDERGRGEHAEGSRTDCPRVHGFRIGFAPDTAITGLRVPASRIRVTLRSRAEPDSVGTCPQRRIAWDALSGHASGMFGRRSGEDARREDFSILAMMLMRMDAKLDLILDELEIDHGEETDHS